MDFITLTITMMRLGMDYFDEKSMVNCNSIDYMIPAKDMGSYKCKISISGSKHYRYSKESCVEIKSKCKEIK